MEDLQSILASLQQIESDIAPENETHIHAQEMAAEGAFADTLIGKVPWDTWFGETVWSVKRGEKPYTPSDWKSLSSIERDEEFLEFFTIYFTRYELLIPTLTASFEKHNKEYEDDVVYFERVFDTSVLKFIDKRNIAHQKYQDELKNTDSATDTIAAAKELYEETLYDIPVPGEDVPLKIAQVPDLIVAFDAVGAAVYTPYNKMKVQIELMSKLITKLMTFLKTIGTNTVLTMKIFEGTGTALCKKYENFQQKYITMALENRKKFQQFTELHKAMKARYETLTKQILKANRRENELCGQDEDLKQTKEKAPAAPAEPLELSSDDLKKEEIAIRDDMNAIEIAYGIQLQNIKVYLQAQLAFVNEVEQNTRRKLDLEDEANLENWTKECTEKKKQCKEAQKKIETQELALDSFRTELTKLKHKVINTCLTQIQRTDAEKSIKEYYIAIQTRMKTTSYTKPDDYDKTHRIYLERVKEADTSERDMNIIYQDAIAAISAQRPTDTQTKLLKDLDKCIDAMEAEKKEFYILSEDLFKVNKTLNTTTITYIDEIKQCLNGNDSEYVKIATLIYNSELIYIQETVAVKNAMDRLDEKRKVFRNLHRQASLLKQPYDQKRLSGKLLAEYNKKYKYATNMTLQVVRDTDSMQQIVEKNQKQLEGAKVQMENHKKQHTQAPRVPAVVQPEANAPAVKKDVRKVPPQAADPPPDRVPSSPGNEAPKLQYLQPLNVLPSSRSGSHQSDRNEDFRPSAPSLHSSSPFQPPSHTDAADEFRDGITVLARCLLVHTYPPAPALPFHARTSFARYAHKDPCAALADANPDLHALCARITHIAGPVYGASPILAAHRFLLEFPPLARILSRALEPRGGGALYAARLDAVPLFPDVRRIRACLDGANLPRLRQLALAVLLVDHDSAPHTHQSSDASSSRSNGVDFSRRQRVSEHNRVQTRGNERASHSYLLHQKKLHSANHHHHRHPAHNPDAIQGGLRHENNSRGSHDENFHDSNV